MSAVVLQGRVAVLSMQFFKSVVLGMPAAALSWLGRQGTRAIAALVILGIAMPPVGAALKPYLSEAVFLLLCIAFVRIDVVVVKAYVRRPALVLVATAWTSVGVPVLFALVCTALGLQARAPELFFGLLLQGIASPMMAAPALAVLMGLDATLVLVTMVASTVLLPVTAPLFAQVFLGQALHIAPLALGIKLVGILTGSILVGLLLRSWVGLAAIGRHTQAINGFNIVVLFVFVAAIMHSVAARFWAAPWMTLGIAVLAFAVFFAVFLATAFAFWLAGRERALALGFMAAQRNMGLMLAATNGVLPDMTWLYFALGQFPIYLSPQLLQPVVRRLRAAPLRQRGMPPT